MSNDEIERRLRDLQPTSPRPGLRDEVLGALRMELGPSGETGFDRFLAKPTPWVIAATFLLALLGANLWLGQRAADERRERRAPLEADARSLVEYRVWLARWTAGAGR